MTEESVHRVVVVGGGFGGLQAALKLRRTPVEVTLVDRRNFHLFQPLTYQVATGALSPGEIAYPLRAIFKRHRNVKCAVSGHIHLVDRVDYLGVTYLCDGAVSGAWWKGSRFDEADPGYALINLYDDGSVEREYVAYGWSPTPEAQASLDDD